MDIETLRATNNERFYTLAISYESSALHEREMLRYCASKRERANRLAKIRRFQAKARECRSRIIER
jgi:hypothetical protein